jgi:hypothetical protein
MLLMRYSSYSRAILGGKGIGFSLGSVSVDTRLLLVATASEFFLTDWFYEAAKRAGSGFCLRVSMVSAITGTRAKVLRIQSFTT